ncbi:erythromycin esterase family protein [Nocardia amikacinitolerans]|uniref:erythromycin esterase family protein n=1 Tax=Nocardia amikacinitolerans TaxID=756689 RepID=UPI002646A297|nr:erythromycin esterase family protein [Nocardia amikacinitolerans]MCP2276048.1 Erythromycin esterase [Nocardia amikacinitolerans]
MSQDIRDFVSASCELVALGEPTHREPSFGFVRNELFVQLVDRGFRSIALETDRVAALVVDDYVRDGVGSLDTAMREGFSHGFGDLAANRELVAWMREYNHNRPPSERLAFHGFDAPMENPDAPSPRRFLEHTRDYLRLDLDLGELLGDDERWDRAEAIMDPAESIGATAEAERLREIADDMLLALYARAPELIAATSRAAWLNAKICLTAGRCLLRYHRQAAHRGDERARLSGLLDIRETSMAKNLLDIRNIEARRGGTVVGAHNAHLQRNRGTIQMAGMDFGWFSAGAIVGSLVGERYAFIAGSLGRSEVLGLGEPEPGTYESVLQGRIADWGLTSADAVTSARPRTDTTPRQGYSPLDRAILDTADAVLHINTGARRDDAGWSPVEPAHGGSGGTPTSS